MMLKLLLECSAVSVFRCAEKGRSRLHMCAMRPFPCLLCQCLIPDIQCVETELPSLSRTCTSASFRGADRCLNGAEVTDDDPGHRIWIDDAFYGALYTD